MSVEGGPASAVNVEDVRLQLMRSPYHQFLNFELSSLGEGQAELRLPFRIEFVVDPRSAGIHGAILAALIDIAGDVAVWSLVGHPVPTIDMRVDFLAPARGVDLVALAHTIRFGKSIAVVDVAVRDPGGELIAAGRCLYAVRS